MDSSTRLCRLCLKTSDDLVNIFETFQNSTIASVLTQHFWFKVDKNDGYPECLCKICWTYVKTFHSFYKRVELIHRNYSVNLAGIETISVFDLIKQVRSGSVREAPLEPDLNIVKCEETELQEQIIDVPIKQEESVNYTDENSCNQSETEQRADDEHQPSNKKRKSDGPSDSIDTENKTLSPGKKWESSSGEDDLDESHQSSNTQLTSRSEKDKEDVLIREFFHMECDICSDVEFKTLLNARKHYRTVHNERNGYITCCGKRFHRRHQVMDHIKHHLNPDAFPCDQCGKRLKNALGLKAHIRTHETFPGSHKCSFCAKTFSAPLRLAEHKRLQHDLEKDQKFHCEKCNKNYPTKYALATHVRIIHELASAQVCEICAHVCKSKPSYRRHMQKHSGTTQPKVQCNICGTWLKHELILRRHLKMHKDEFVNCSICNKEIRKHLLNAHIRCIHNMERRHHCTLCEKAFKYPKLLKEHMAVHTGQDLYKCTYCERMFKSGANLYSHRKKAHFPEWTRDCAKSTVAEKTSTSNDASQITTNSH